MDRSYVAIDIETTGLDAKQDKIIEIGAVKVIDGEETERFSTFVNPRRDLPERIVRLTGIQASMLEDAPDIEDVIKDAVEFAGDLPLLGHRILFDYSFLKESGFKLGKDFRMGEKWNRYPGSLQAIYAERRKEKSVCGLPVFSCANENGSQGGRRRQGGQPSVSCADGGLRGRTAGRILAETLDLPRKKRTAGYKKAKRTLA